MNNRYALATFALIVIATIVFGIFLLSLDDTDDDDRPEGAVSTERHDIEENKPENAAAETANALATAQTDPTNTLTVSQAQDATNAMAATSAQATINAFEGNVNGTPAPENSRQVTLTINELYCIEAQEDRLLSVDGYGDEVYVIYVLTERDPSGTLRQALVESWGVVRMESGDTVSEGEFTPISMTISADSSVDVAITVMESEDIARADRFVNTLKDDIDNIGSDILDTIIPGQNFGVSDLLVVLDLGVEVLEYFGQDDMLGEITQSFSPDELSQAGPIIRREETLRRNRMLEKFEYRLEYSLRVE